MTVEAAAEQAIAAAPLPLRFLALVIDAGIYFVTVNLILRLTGDDLLILAAESEAPLFTLAWAAFYELGFLILWSATPGKRLLGMYVAQGDSGRRVRPLNAAIRVVAFHFFFLTYFLSETVLETRGWLFLGLLILSLSMALADPDKHRALHDRIAGTRVLKGHAPRKHT